MSPEDLAVVGAMELLGGSFVKALAVAALKADPINLARLRAAFPDYWREYADLAARAAARRTKS